MGIISRTGLALSRFDKKTESAKIGHDVVIPIIGAKAMIVVTAGHVDHGKTMLIKALTGTDTTHLPEERRRGMTIDLGFAGLALPGGGFIGFVDVPGHERFTRNMLAGISGVDLALLVVAADDGIMPQTREHLEILDLLDVAEGAIVLTKIDRVNDERVAVVTASIKQLLASTSLVRAPVFPVSAPQNVGIAELRDYLLSHNPAATKTRRDAGFRLPIDRSFVADGAGLVVTGTVASGKVAVGDRLTLMPQGRQIRVRGLHAHRNAVQSLGAGERGALNIVASDLDRSEVGRGSWMVSPGIAVTTQHVDVRLRPSARCALKDGARIHFCHGTASIPGRLILLSGDAQAPYAQIVLDAPVHALTRDRFILRRVDSLATLAGGVVVDPLARPRGRRQPTRIAMLVALDSPDPARALASLLLRAEDGIELERFAQAWNLCEKDAEMLWASAGLQAFKGRGYDAARWRRGREALLSEVAQFHLAYPESAGPLAAQLLQLDEAAGRPFQQAILESLIADKELMRDGTRIRRPSHEIELSPGEKTLWQRIAPLLGPSRRPMTANDIAKTQKLDPKLIKRTLLRAVRAGYVVRISDGRFLHRAAFLDLVGKAETLAASCSGGLFDAASFRDQSHLGRGISIELLEHFDRIGFTERVGDQRRVLKSAAAVVDVDAADENRGISPA